MNTIEINEESLATLHELAEGLPRCKRCGALAVGEFAGTVRVIGRKRYGESWVPFCEKHPTGEGPIVRLFAYHRAAERYNHAYPVATPDRRAQRRATLGPCPSVCSCAGAAS